MEPEMRPEMARYLDLAIAAREARERGDLAEAERLRQVASAELGPVRRYRCGHWLEPRSLLTVTDAQWRFLVHCTRLLVCPACHHGESLMDDLADGLTLWPSGREG